MSHERWVCSSMTQMGNIANWPSFHHSLHRLVQNDQSHCSEWVIKVARNPHHMAEMTSVHPAFTTSLAPTSPLYAEEPYHPLDPFPALSYPLTDKIPVQNSNKLWNGLARYPHLRLKTKIWLGQLTHRIFRSYLTIGFSFHNHNYLPNSFWKPPPIFARLRIPLPIQFTGFHTVSWSCQTIPGCKTMSCGLFRVAKSLECLVKAGGIISDTELSEAKSKVGWNDVCFYSTSSVSNLHAVVLTRFSIQKTTWKLRVLLFQVFLDIN